MINDKPGFVAFGDNPAFTIQGLQRDQDKLKERITALEEAIKAHQKAVMSEDHLMEACPMEFDKKLWEVLGDES